MTPRHVTQCSLSGSWRRSRRFQLGSCRLHSFNVVTSPPSLAVCRKSLTSTRSSLEFGCSHTDSLHLGVIMSFDRLSSLESQPTTTRRQDDPQYRDDPEFQRFTESLSTKLFELISNISRLSSQLSKKDTERGRERIHDLLEETRNGFKEAGEGIKKAQAWADQNVSAQEVCAVGWLT